MKSWNLCANLLQYCLPASERLLAFILRNVLQCYLRAQKSGDMFMYPLICSCIHYCTAHDKPSSRLCKTHYLIAMENGKLNFAPF